MAIPDILAPGGDAYVLRVRGDSMIEAHIADGDFVLIRPQTTARNGDIVVAQVEENAVTLKRFFKEKDQIRLQPANPAYPAQFYDDVLHPGEAHRSHPPARLGAWRTARRRRGRPMRALAGSARSLTHRGCARSRARRPPSPAPPTAPILGLRARFFPAIGPIVGVDIHRKCPQWAHMVEKLWSGDGLVAAFVEGRGPVGATIKTNR